MAWSNLSDDNKGGNNPDLRGNTERDMSGSTDSCGSYRWTERWNMDVLKGGNMDGIAVVSAIMKAEHPKEAAQKLKAHVKELK